MALNPGTHSGTPTWARQDVYHYNLATARKLNETVESTIDSSNGSTAANVQRGLIGTISANSPEFTSIDFDGATSFVDYAAISAATYPATFTAWIRQDTVVNATAISIVDPTVGDQQLTIGTQDVGGTLYAKVFWYSTANNRLDSTGALTLNKWHHIAGIFAADGSMEIFVDGVSDGTDATVQANPTGLTQPTIGRQSDSTPGGYFPGRLHDCRWYDTVLTDDEILRIYMHGATEASGLQLRGCADGTTDDLEGSADTPTATTTITHNALSIDDDGKNFRALLPLVSNINLQSSTYHHTPSGTDVIFTREDDGESRNDIAILINNVYVGLMVWNAGNSQHEATISGLDFYEVVTVDFLSLLDGIRDRIAAYIGSIGSLVHWFDFSNDDLITFTDDKMEIVRDGIGPKFLYQSSASKRAVVGAINGVQTAWVDGTNEMQIYQDKVSEDPAAANTTSLAGDLTLVFVTQMDNPGTGWAIRALIGNGAADYVGVRSPIELDVRENSVHNYVTTTHNYDPHIFVYRRTGTTWTGGINGYDKTWGHTSVTIPWILNWFFSRSANQFWYGSVGEIRVFNKSLADAELDILIAELNTKWGL